MVRTVIKLNTIFNNIIIVKYLILNIKGLMSAESTGAIKCLRFTGTGGRLI